MSRLPCAAGAVGDTVQRVHETVQGTSRSFLVNLASMVAGFRATTGIVKTHIHREGGTNQWQMTEGVHWERWDWHL